ncbi:MAG: CPBP family intramembrane glutamic endopeptidase [Marmoricola sp.]
MSRPPGPPAQLGSPYGEPTAYPRLLNTPSYAWWRAVVGILLLLVGVFVLSGSVLLPVLAVAIWVQSQIEGVAFSGAFRSATSIDALTPASMLWLNLVLASGTLVAFALVRWLHHVRPRWLTSVRPGLRTRFFLACLGLSVVAMAVQVALILVLPGDGDTGSGGGPVNHLGPRSLAFVLVILLTTPLQAMGEEYVFRGYLMQAFGSFFRRWDRVSLWGTVLVTSLAFAIAHGSQDAPVFFDRFAFGVLAGYLVIRIGGLEAGIALHIMNNFFAYGLALLFGDITAVLVPTSGSWWSLPATVVQSVVYLLLVLLVARRMGVTNRTISAAVEEPSQALPGPPSPIGEPRG